MKEHTSQKTLDAVIQSFKKEYNSQLHQLSCSVESSLEIQEGNPFIRVDIAYTLPLFNRESYETKVQSNCIEKLPSLFQYGDTSLPVSTYFHAKRSKGILASLFW